MPGVMDERVVSMEFDNRQFEKNVRHSMKTIDDLKESLDFEKSSESLGQLDKSFKKFGENNVFHTMDESAKGLRGTMSLLGSSATSLIGKFAEVTKIVALFDMAEAAVQRLKRSISQFTIAPISEGFSKYETKISSIKTISNATGMAADSVNDQLERLNWFTDETSASFGEMVNNIGKFTSVGRQLNESITAMQGIANWGYQSGAGVSEINRAMYNLSQALGTGSVKLIDWKSIENAGMATKEFKEQAIAAAEAAGTLKRKGDKLFTKKGNKEVNFSNFNETLQQGWFTSDVLMSTLEVYGGYADKVRNYIEKHPQYSIAAQAMEAMDSERLDNRLDIFGKTMDLWVEKTGKTAEDINAEIERIKGIEDLEEREKEISKFVKSLGVDANEIARINKITNVKEREKEIAKWAKTVNIDVKQATKILDDYASTEESLGEKAFKSAQQSKSFRDSIEATKDAVSTQWMNSFQTIFGGLEESVELWSDVTELLWELFASGGDARNNMLTHWAEEFGGRDDLWGPDGVLHSIMDTIIELKELLGTSFKNVFFPDLERVAGILSTDEGLGISNGLYTVDQIRNRREGSFMGKQLKGVTQGIKEFFQSIRAFFKDEGNIKKIQTIFTTIARVIKLITDTIGKVFKMIGNVINRTGIFQDILNIVTRISEVITDIIQKIEKSQVIDTVLTGIGDTLVWFYDLIKGWITQIYEFFNEIGLFDLIADFFGGMGDSMASGASGLLGWIGTIKEFLENINLKSVLYSIKGFIENFADWLETSGVLPTIRRWFNAVIDFFRGIDFGHIFSTVSNTLSNAFTWIKERFSDFTNWLESSGILPTIRSWFNAVVDFFRSMNFKKIFEFFGNIASAVGGAFSKAFTWVKDRWNSLVNWLDDIGVLPKIKYIAKKIGDFFGNIGLIWNIFVRNQGQYDPNDLSDDQLSIIQGIENFINGIKEKFEWIRDKFIQIKDTVVGWLNDTGILPTLKGWWSDIADWFGSLEIPDNPLGEIGDFFVELYDTVTGLFGGGDDEESIELPSVGTPDVSGGEASSNSGKKKKKPNIFQQMFANIKEAFTNEDGSLNLVKGFSVSITKVLNGIVEILKRIDFKMVFDFVSNILVDGLNSLDDALGKFHYGNIYKIMMDFVKILGAFKAATVINNVFKTIRDINNKDKDKKSALEKITELFKAIGLALLQIGIAVLLIVASLWIISKIDAGRLTGAVVIISIIFAVFIALVVLCAKFKENEEMADRLEAIGKSMLQIGISIMLITLAIVAMTLLIKNQNIGNIFAAVGIIVLMLAVVVGVIYLISLITKKVGEAKIQVALDAFLGISALIVAMTLCVLMLQAIDVGRAFINVGVLAVMLLAIAAAIWIMGKAEISEDVYKVVLTLAGIIGILTVAFILLQSVDIGQMLAIAGGFALVIIAIGLAFLMMKKVEVKPTTVAAIKLISLIIGEVGGILAIVQDMEWSTAIAVLGGLAVFLVGMAGAMLILDKVKMGPAQAAKTGSAIAILLTAIMTALSLTGHMVSGAVKKIIDAVLHVITTMQSMSNSAKNIDHDAIMDAFDLLDDIAEALGTVLSCDTGPALTVSDAAWTVLNRLKLASRSANNIDAQKMRDVFGENGEGGLLKDIEKSLASIQEPGTMAARLGKNLEILGNSLQLAGTSGLMLSKELTTEGLAGKTYTEGIQNIKTQMDVIQEITGIASSIGTINSNITKKLGTNLESLGNSLQAVGVAGSTLGNGSKNDAGIKNIKKRMTDIWEIVTLATSLGKSEENGEVKQYDLTELASGIANIGASLQLYDKAMATFKEEYAKAAENTEGDDLAPVSTENIQKALQSIVDVIADVKLPDETKRSGIEQWASLTTGDNGTTNFALGLANIANAMTVFSDAADNYNDQNGQKAINALGTLAGIFNKVNNPASYTGKMNMVAQWKPGMNNDGTAQEGTFANAIIGMGNAMVSFSESAKSYDSNSGGKAIDALQLLANIYDNFSNPSKYSSMIENAKDANPGDVNVDGTFANVIVGLGNAMSAFGQSVNDIPAFSVWNAIIALRTLATLHKELSGQQELMEFLAGGNKNDEALKIVAALSSTSASTTLGELGEGIGKLGDGFSSFAQQATVGEDGKEINVDRLKTVVEILTTLGELHMAITRLELEKDWWQVLFDVDGGLASLGSGLANLTPSLETFAQTLNDENSPLFNLEADQWIAIGTFLAKMSEIAANLTYVSGYTGGTLKKFANDLEEFVKEFDDVEYEMEKMITVVDEAGNEKTLRWGELNLDNWNTITTFIDYFKQMTMDFEGKDLSYTVSKFGQDIHSFFNVLFEQGFDGNALSGYSQKNSIVEVFNQLSNHVIDANAISTFASGIKSLADTIRLIHDTGVTADDIGNLKQIMSAVFGFDIDGNLPDNFDATIFGAAGRVLTGFSTALREQVTGTTSEGETVGSIFDTILESVDFFAKGKAAGEQYAKGFESGLGLVTNISSDGHVTNGTIGDLTFSMIGMATNTLNISNKLDTIEGYYKDAIAVKDDHTDIIERFNTANDKLQNISSDVRSLKNEVNNLKVYVYPNKLVGAIAGGIDRALGGMVNIGGRP